MYEIVACSVGHGIGYSFIHLFADPFTHSFVFVLKLIRGERGVHHGNRIVFLNQLL